MGAGERKRERERAVRRCSARVVHSAVLQVYLSSGKFSREKIAQPFTPNHLNGINKINDASPLSSPPR